MKFRTNFVSNSSSSSFVAIGFDVDPSWDLEELLKKSCEEYHSKRTNFMINEEGFEEYVMLRIADGHGEEIGKEEFTFSYLMDSIKSLKEFLGITDDREPKLIVGSRMC